MEVEVIVPEEYIGDVMSDINSRRGNINGMNQRKDAHVLESRVPLVAMFGYATDLRSLTQGRAIFSMEFSSFEQVPAGIQSDIIERIHGKAS